MYTHAHFCRSSGSIAGIVVGCIIGIVCLGVFIVVCCKMMNKNRGATGRVVYPNNGNGNVTILNTQNHSGSIIYHRLQKLIYNFVEFSLKIIYYLQINSSKFG